LFRFDLIACVTLANIVILAKLTLEITPSEEDGPGTSPASQGIFLAQMRAIAAHLGPVTSAAHAHLSVATIDVTIPCTHVAYRKVLIGLGYALSQLPTAQKLQIGWLNYCIGLPRRFHIDLLHPSLIVAGFALLFKGNFEPNIALTGSPCYTIPR
jgi:hypothetical protein